MPQFLKTRYNESVALVMAIFWLLLYVFVNFTSILYLGAVAINGLLGGDYLHLVMIGLMLMALIITLGGMKVIGYTDVIQVAVLIIGGFATVYMALQIVDQRINHVIDGSALAGFNTLLSQAPEHFHLILPKPNNTDMSAAGQLARDKYIILPGIAMYFAGQWILNLNYWGCNQYITQRALGAQLETARKGILFAGFMKLFMPVIVMLPGIAAFVLYKNGQLAGFEGGKDGAYSAILAFLPAGLKGLAIAALTAAIVASLAGKANSISTIFTLDIYKKYINQQADEKKLVWTGRLTVFISMVIAVIFTWKDLLGISGEGGFTFIQKYTGFISPGVFAMFMLGFFWKRTTGAAAMTGLITGFLLAIFFNSYAIPLFGTDNIMYTAYLNKSGAYEIPFLINMGWSFVLTVIIMVIVSMAGPKVNPKAFEIDASMFKVSKSTLVLIVIILMLLSALYVKFW
jgi:SSS family solute:Na+ symporter